MEWWNISLFHDPTACDFGINKGGSIKLAYGGDLRLIRRRT
jgi:hypothetical protein